MADKGKSLKLQKWTKKDVALVITAYVINAVLFTLLFVGMCYLNASVEKKLVSDTLSEGVVVGFAIIISLILAITALYFMFEDRDFLRKPSNSQMLFLIWELGVVVCFISGKFLNPYVRPVAMVAI